MQDIELSNLTCKIHQHNNHEIKIYIPSTGDILNGFSSSYSNTYPSELTYIMSQTEFEEFIEYLNNIITDYWPCGPCVTFGYLCFPCSFIPCFPTNLCVSQSEKHAVAYLERFKLKSKYYDRYTAYVENVAYVFYCVNMHIAYISLVRVMNVIRLYTYTYSKCLYTV